MTFWSTESRANLLHEIAKLTSELSECRTPSVVSQESQEAEPGWLQEAGKILSKKPAKLKKQIQPKQIQPKQILNRVLCHNCGINPETMCRLTNTASTDLQCGVANPEKYKNTLKFSGANKLSYRSVNEP